MKKNQPPVPAPRDRSFATSRRDAFEHQLIGYSALGASAVVIAAVAATSATATAQIVPINTGNLTVSLESSLTGTDTNTTRRNNGAVGFGASQYPHLTVVQSNRTSSGTHCAKGTAQLFIANFLADGQVLATASGAKNLGLGVQVHTGNTATLRHTGILFQTQSAFAPHYVFGNKVAGNFGPGATGYVGFKTGAGGHYGWLRVRVDVDINHRPASVSFIADGDGNIGAYSQDGSAIYAGQLTAIPEPSTVATGLALFALGAAGVREHRRRKQAA